MAATHSQRTHRIRYASTATLLATIMMSPFSMLKADTSFVDTFDGQPGAPQIFSSPNWDVALMTRDRQTWFEVNPGNTAAHGPDCSPPPASHPVRLLEETVYRCKDHMMTAMNDDSFGVVTLTPNRMLDLTEERATVSFDVSTLRKGGYDWIEIVLTPFENNLVHPASEFWQVAGPPENAIQIAMTPGTDNTFTLTKFQNGESERYHFCARCEGANFWTSYGGEQLPLIPSERRRETFELTISDDDRLSFGVVNYFDGQSNDKSFYWLDSVDISPLDWQSAVVQIQHFSFNPTNNCGNDSCDGDTWHWDNVSIDPAVPFTIIPSLTRYVDPTVNANSNVQFASASPSDAYVRFSAIGTAMELSTDGGQTWQSAQLQHNAENTSALEGRFRNYFHPIPAGVTNIEFRGNNWWGGSWHARDLSIWAR